tara:strand:- start:737 stop:937 length:201 start_codon:yes stop_codon:yes gene_type:complete
MLLTSNPTFFASLNDSITSTFGLPIESGDYEVKIHSWGTLIHVHTGEFAGTYDLHVEDGFYKFITA